jgi:hypothetical protein
MRKNLEREIAAAALGGGQGTEPILALVTTGLDVLRGTRLTLRAAGLKDGLGAVRSSKTGRDYVRVALPRGVTARFHLTPPEPTLINGRVAGHMVPLLTILPVQGKPRLYFDVPPAAKELARRAGTDVEAASRILLGLERARRRCYELAEEATRWL